MFTQPNEEIALEFLKKSEHFSEAEDPILLDVLSKVQWLAIPSRQVLVRQGQSCSEIYIVYSGKLEFEKTNTDNEIVARGEFSAGDIVGEISFFRDNTSVAKVFTTRNCILMQLQKKDFESFLLNCSKALLSITRKAIYIADTSLNAVPPPKKHSSIALVPLDKEVDLESFGTKLTNSLHTFGKTAFVSKQQIENKVGKGRAAIDFTESQVAEKLSRLNRFTEQYSYLVTKSDYEVNAWSKTVTDEADRILLVAHANNPCDLSLLEQKLQNEKNELSPKFDLVLLRKENEKPSKTLQHLINRSIERCHHVRIENAEDYDKLARILTGNSIGLALGGGGVRAASQIGLIKAFNEARIPIDHICGTSIGSLVAGLYAAGFSTDNMQSIVEDSVVNSNLFNDYTLPIVSLVKGKKFSEFLERIFNGQLIEDMPTDYFSVATNLSTGQLETFERGHAWKAVRASASLPAILPPYVDENGLYLDGGLLDNLPGNMLRQRGIGKIIAIDVSSAINFKKDKNLFELTTQAGSTPKLRKIIRNKYSKTPLDYPSIGEIISRSMVVGSRDRSEKIKETADIYIRMPVDEYGMLDFKECLDLIQLGYEFSIKHIDVWKTKLLGS